MNFQMLSELIDAGQYLSEAELAHIPDNEKGILAGETYNFHYNQPENVERPYPYGEDFHKAGKAVRPQIPWYGGKKTIAECLYEFLLEFDPLTYAKNVVPGASKEDVLAEIEAHLRNPEQAAKICDYLNESILDLDLADEEIQLADMLINAVNDLPSMGPSSELREGTVVYIGTDKYEIQSMSDETVILHDLTYPLFTKDFSREEFERKLRENPANDHLKIRQSLPGLPAENKKEEPDIPEPASDEVPAVTEQEAPEPEDVQADLTPA